MVVGWALSLGLHQVPDQQAPWSPVGRLEGGGDHPTQPLLAHRGQEVGISMVTPGPTVA